MDYQSLYDEYWSRADRFGSASFGNADYLAKIIVSALGAGSYLDVGCGMGDLVQALLLRGMDARGVDVSTIAIAEGMRRIPGRFTEGSILDLPFHDASFDNVVSTDCLEHLAPEDVPKALSELRRIARRGVFLVVATRQDRDKRWHLTVENRLFWERAAIESGLRRHPASLEVTSYADLNHETGNAMLVLEPIPETLARVWPLSALARERDLHMDMLREAGSRSDAHLVRYQQAAAMVRPGDCVLDAACGLGYGSWLLATRTAAERVCGLDIDATAIDYARIAFPSRKLSFEAATLPRDLDRLDAASFDVIVCFETLEHVAEPAALLSAFRRLLVPGGRLIASVPHDWSDETGRDPNPHHMDIYDWPKLTRLISATLILDRAYCQTADRAKVNGSWTQQTRGWRAFDPRLPEPPFPAEWLIAVAVRPVHGEPLPPWNRPLRSAGQAPRIAPVDFARMLDEPWLGRGLLDRGLRIQEPDALRLLCESLAAAPGRRNQAAALTVMGYQLLREPSTAAERPLALLARIDAWLDQPRDDTSADPCHDTRWRISLTFVAARLCQKIGDLSGAETWFERCLSHDAARFGPTLFTKTVDAAHRLGWMRRARGDLSGAARSWDAGLAQAQAALRIDLSEAFGDVGLRFEFAFNELAQICETANLCAIALERLECDPDNAERQSEILYRPRERVETLQEHLRSVRVASARAPTGPSPMRSGGEWTTRGLLRPNEWCRAPNASDKILVLHPTRLGYDDQPEAVMVPIVPAGARYVVFLAEAPSSSERNVGVVLRFGDAEASDEALKSVELPPREPVTLTLPLADLNLANGGAVRFTVATRAGATSISSSAVRIVYVGPVR